MQLGYLDFIMRGWECGALLVYGELCDSLSPSSPWDGGGAQWAGVSAFCQKRRPRPSADSAPQCLIMSAVIVWSRHFKAEHLTRGTL